GQLPPTNADPPAQMEALLDHRLVSAGQRAKSNPVDAMSPAARSRIRVRAFARQNRHEDRALAALMHRFALALLLVACAAPSRAPPPPAPQLIPSPSGAPQVTADAGVASPEPVGVPHGGPGIALIAVADDGTAALTADSSGELRLWPTLDGSRPPIRVD